MENFALRNQNLDTYVYCGGGWPWAMHGKITSEPSIAVILDALSLMRGGETACGSENSEFSN